MNLEYWKFIFLPHTILKKKDTNGLNVKKKKNRTSKELKVGANTLYDAETPIWLGCFVLINVYHILLSSV